MEQLGEEGTSTRPCNIKKGKKGMEEEEVMGQITRITYLVSPPSLPRRKRKMCIMAYRQESS